MENNDERFPVIPHSTDGANFVGEALLEISFNSAHPNLYEVVGLDSDEWQIAGIHTSPANAYHSSGYVTIYAIDRTKGDPSDTGLGSVDVVKFETDLTFDDILSPMKGSSIFYKSKGLQESDFYISDERELPGRS